MLVFLHILPPFVLRFGSTVGPLAVSEVSLLLLQKLAVHNTRTWLGLLFYARGCYSLFSELMFRFGTTYGTDRQKDRENRVDMTSVGLAHARPKLAPIIPLFITRSIALRQDFSVN